MWVWSSRIPMADDIIARPRLLVSVNDLIGGSMRAVRGVWDSGATINVERCLIRVPFPVCIIVCVYRINNCIIIETELL